MPLIPKKTQASPALKIYEHRWGVPEHIQERVKTGIARYNLLVSANTPPYCWYCGKDTVNQLTVDHIIPISKGGTDLLDNLRFCCKTCNAAKGDLSVKSFRFMQWAKSVKEKPRLVMLYLGKLSYKFFGE